ncbi:MAG: hypothetical protein ABJM29_00105 [Rhizobiaceae bacterium]
MPDDSPNLYLPFYALQIAGTQILVYESVARQFFGQTANHKTIAPGDALQTRGQIGRLANYGAFLRSSFADDFPNHDHSGGDANSHGQINPLFTADSLAEGLNCLDDGQPAGHCSFCVALERFWIAKIDQNSVAHKFGDKAFVFLDQLCTFILIGPNDILIVLRIQFC